MRGLAHPRPTRFPRWAAPANRARAGVPAPGREGGSIHREYVTSGFLALRTPMLPFSTLETWAAGLTCARDPDDAACWRRDREAARAVLRAHLAEPLVHEAIALASPALLERLPAWLADPDAEPGVEAGLVKYVSRMAARATPFGTFAGTSLARIGGAPRLELPSRRTAVRHSRLDMDALSEVVAVLERDPAIRAGATYSPNTSLYRIGDTLRYAEARRRDGVRTYFLVSVEANDAVVALLDAARGGATLDALADVLASDELPREDVLAFVHELVDAQLLVADLGPVVTGPDALDELIGRLDRFVPAHPARATLAATRDALHALDAGGLGAPDTAYAAIARGLAPLVDADPAKLLQVNLHRPAPEAALDEGLVDELLRASDLLLGLFTRGRTDGLEEFRRAFEGRYGDREVALVEALDEEHGIGFGASQGPDTDPSPLLSGLQLPSAPGENRPRFDERLEFLQWRVASAIAANAAEVRLEPAELERFRDPENPGLPGAFHVMAVLLAGDPGDPATPRAVFESAAGPSGIRMLGRFGHGDPELAERMREHARAEAALRPDVTYFEIVHMPEGRVGNVIARPLLREYELAWLGSSGAPPERTLDVNDLTVRLESGRIALRSRRLGCDVRPRLTSAHQTAIRSLGTYRFLAALQAEGVAIGTAWPWGPLEYQPRLPRVRMGRIVLARQRWNASADEAKRLHGRTGHDAFRAVQRWRAERGLPRFVGLVNADNVLPLDLDQPLSVDAFLSELSGRDPFTLEELLPGARPDPVESPEGRLAAEVVIPIVRRPVAPPPRPAGALRTHAAGESAFDPGSEWLTVKLYAGPAAADRVLVEAVAPAFEQLLADGVVRGGFFVRYADPDTHLRVRLQGEPQRLLAEAFPRLRAAYAPFVDAGTIHRVQLEPYVRETLRYGGPRGIVECEAIFRHDSRAAMAFVAAAPGERGLDARWRFVLLGMDRLMEDFGRTLEQRRALQSVLARGFADEHRVDSPARKRIMSRWREERAGIEALLAGAVPDDSPLAIGAALLAGRSRAIAPHVAALRALDAAGELTVGVDDLLGSLLHMHANRVLRSSARAHELVIHHWLESAYASRLARGAGEGRA